MFRTGLFYYTLIILLIVVLTAAVCLSAFLVTRKRRYLYASVGFVVYFFDVGLVFHDDFVMPFVETGITSFYHIGTPEVSAITGAGLIAALWLSVCDVLEIKALWAKVLPEFLFFVASIAIAWSMPVDNVREFTFYTMRECALAVILIVALIWYVRADEQSRLRLRRYAPIFAVVLIGGVLVEIENIFFLLIYDPQHAATTGPLFLPERSFAENALAIALAFVAARRAIQSLALRYSAPPSAPDSAQEAFIDSHLVIYANRHGLSERETEVLREILLGADNQAIATSMHLALSTVKVHVHRILQKTHATNRQELLQDFWRH